MASTRLVRPQRRRGGGTDSRRSLVDQLPGLRFQPLRRLGLPSAIGGRHSERRCTEALSDLYGRLLPVANGVRLELQHNVSRALRFGGPRAQPRTPGRHRLAIGVVSSAELPAQSGFFVPAYEAGDCDPEQHCVRHEQQTVEQQHLAHDGQQHPDIDRVSYVPVEAVDNQVVRRGGGRRHATGSGELDQRPHQRHQA
jgi:hypothetical protein